MVANFPLQRRISQQSRSRCTSVPSLKFLFVCSFALQACGDPPKPSQHQPNDAQLFDNMGRAADILTQRLDSAIQVKGFTIIAVENFGQPTTFGFPVTAPWHLECSAIGIEIDIGAESGDNGPTPDAVISLTRHSVSTDQCASLVPMLTDRLMIKMVAQLHRVN